MSGKYRQFCAVQNYHLNKKSRYGNRKTIFLKSKLPPKSNSENLRIIHHSSHYLIPKCLNKDNLVTMMQLNDPIQFCILVILIIYLQ